MRSEEAETPPPSKSCHYPHFCKRVTSPLSREGRGSILGMLRDMGKPQPFKWEVGRGMGFGRFNPPLKGEGTINPKLKL
jgi:hypothetical protein